MSVQPFLQQIPDTLSSWPLVGSFIESAWLHTGQRTVLPLKTLLIKFFCSIKDFAVVSLITEKSIFAIVFFIAFVFALHNGGCTLIA